MLTRQKHVECNRWKKPKLKIVLFDLIWRVVNAGVVYEEFIRWDFLLYRFDFASLVHAMLLLMTLRNMCSLHSLAAIWTRYRFLAFVPLVISQGFRVCIIATAICASKLAGFLVGFGVRIQQTGRRDVLNEMVAFVTSDTTIRTFVFSQFHDVPQIGPRWRALAIACLACLVID